MGSKCPPYISPLFRKRFATEHAHRVAAFQLVKLRVCVCRVSTHLFRVLRGEFHRQEFRARFLLACWLRSLSTRTDMPVAVCTARTALSVLLTC